MSLRAECGTVHRAPGSSVPFACVCDERWDGNKEQTQSNHSVLGTTRERMGVVGMLLSEKLPVSLQDRWLSWTDHVLPEVERSEHIWEPSDVV